MLMIAVICPKGVQASVKSKVIKLTDEMDLFAFYQIETNFMAKQYMDRKNYTVKLDRKNMATAAAFSIWDDKTYEEEKNDYIVYKLSGNKLRKRGKSLFGKSVAVSSLSTNKDQSHIFFAIQENDQPYIYETIFETEVDMNRKSISVKKASGSAYTVAEKLYCGYWSENAADPNYKIIYEIEKDAASSYGYIIKSMKIKRISSKK